jgi:hypothetical protein
LDQKFDMAPDLAAPPRALTGGKWQGSEEATDGCSIIGAVRIDEPFYISAPVVPLAAIVSARAADPEKCACIAMMRDWLRQGVKSLEKTLTSHLMLK